MEQSEEAIVDRIRSPPLCYFLTSTSTTSSTPSMEIITITDSNTKRLLNWLTSTGAARVGKEFWVDLSVGHNCITSLYLKYCGNKSIAIEHDWHSYLVTFGPTHLRRCSRSLRALTTNIRKIDETANLRGSLPRQLGYISGLQEIYARRVGLTGRLPYELGELRQLRVLSMGNNQLCGELPSSLGSLRHLQRIVLHQNRLIGAVPDSLGKLGCIVNLAGNPGLQHGQDVPQPEKQSLLDIFAATGGSTHWNVKSHWGQHNYPVNKWYKVGVLSSHVHSIVMSSNGMTGSLPQTIGNLTQLCMIELATMPELTGSLPKSLCSIRTLRRLCICRCGLTGQIPEEIGCLLQLEELQLFGNQFSGTIPHSIKNLVNLKLLSLGEYTGGNNFSPAALPIAFSYLHQLEALFLANCNIRGPLPEWIGNLTELRQLDLQHNQLSGILPHTIGRLTNVLYLNLKDNTQLGGTLPVNALGQLTKLNRLSLVHCAFDTSVEGQTIPVLQARLPRCKIWA
jgi:Leucine-rich repeat (LRR) protein